MVDPNADIGGEVVIFSKKAEKAIDKQNTAKITKRPQNNIQIKVQTQYIQLTNSKRELNELH